MERIENKLPANVRTKQLDLYASEPPSDARDEIIARIISRSRRSQGYGPLVAKEILEWADDWSTILKAIPTERLEEFYVEAIEIHKKGDGPFAPCEIMARWELDRENANRHAGRTLEPALGNCKSCWDTGWMSIIAKHTENHPMMCTYSRPCTCPAGKQFDRSYQKAIFGQRKAG